MINKFNVNSVASNNDLDLQWHQRMTLTFNDKLMTLSLNI